MVIVLCHCDRKVTKTEVDPRKWAIAVKHLIILVVGRNADFGTVNKENSHIL